MIIKNTDDFEKEMKILDEKDDTELHEFNVKQNANNEIFQLQEVFDKKNTKNLSDPNFWHNLLFVIKHSDDHKFVRNLPNFLQSLLSAKYSLTYDDIESIDIEHINSVVYNGICELSKYFLTQHNGQQQIKNIFTILGFYPEALIDRLFCFAIEQNDLDNARTFFNLKTEQQIKSIPLYYLKKYKEKINDDKIIDLLSFYNLNLNKNKSISSFFFHSILTSNPNFNKFDIDVNFPFTIPYEIQGQNNKDIFNIAYLIIINQKNLNSLTEFYKIYGSKIKINMAVNSFSPFSMAISFIDNVKFPFMIENLNLMTQYCELNERNILDIMNVCLKQHNTINYHQHELFDNLFNHSLIKNNENFSNTVLNQILSVILAPPDNIFLSTHLDPYISLLNKFDKHVGISNWIKIFVSLSHSKTYLNQEQINFFYEKTQNLLKPEYFNNQKISKNFRDFLIEKKLIEKQPFSFFNIGSKELIAIAPPQKDPFFKNSNINNSISDSTTEAIEAKPNSNNQINSLIVDKITDIELKKYISSISLNLEHFEIFENLTISSDDKHYVFKVLPKFVNKCLENYLEMSSLDEQEAKNNAIEQLKLLNLKLSKILKNISTAEKEILQHENSVQSRNLKQY